MADIDRDYTDRNRTERERVYAVNSGGTAGWWIGGVLVLAVLIIGFIALSGGEPAPVDTAPTTVENTVTTAPAPAAEPAPMTEAAPAGDAAAPATETAPAETAVEPAPAETAPAAPVEPAPAPAE